MKKILLNGMVAMACVVMIVSIIFNISVSPYEKARHEAMKLVTEEGLVQQVKQFYLYQGSQVVYSIYGTSAEDSSKHIYVLIEKDTKKAYAYHQSDLIDETRSKQIVSEKKPNAIVLNVRLGVENGEPIWEVSYKTDTAPLNYIVIAAKTGDVIREVITT